MSRHVEPGTVANGGTDRQAQVRAWRARRAGLVGCLGVVLGVGVVCAQTPQMSEVWTRRDSLAEPLAPDEPVDISAFTDRANYPDVRTWVYVTGYMSNPIYAGRVVATYRYDKDDPQGVPRTAYFPSDWQSTTRYHSAVAMVVDQDETDPNKAFVYVAAEVQNADGSYDFITIKYNKNLVPSPTWPDLGDGVGVRRYNRIGNSNDRPVDVLVYDEGAYKRIVVTGTTFEGSGQDDITTVCYSASDGVEKWAHHYNGPGNGADKAVEEASLRIAGTTGYGPRRGQRPGAGLARKGEPLIGAAAVGAALCAAPGALGQCQPTWTLFPLADPRRANAAFEVEVFDEDGPGPIPPAVYAAEVGMWFGDYAVRIARWDGWAWSTAANLNDRSIPGVHEPSYRSVEALLALEGDGIPGGLFAGGQISYSGTTPLSPNVARGSGSRWLDVDGGVQTIVYALGAFDEDGPGQDPMRLFVGGPFLAAGSDPAIPRLARWNGVRFSAVGAGLGRANEYPLAFAVFDDDGPGPGPPALFVGGEFSVAGGLVAHDIARWDGTNWSNVGGPESGSNSDVLSLCVFDEDGPGPGRAALFMGGGFNAIGGPTFRLVTPGGLARWDGERWSTVAGFSGGTVRAMAVFDDDGPGPSRPALFITGWGIQVNGQYANAIAKWDGQQWHRLENGLWGWGPVGTSAESMCVLDEDGPGPNPGGLYIAGGFLGPAGQESVGFTRWGCPLPPRCYADCDRSTGPGALDIFDFLCFQNRYSVNDPSACDCDASTGPRVCDILDFLCFQNAFAAGCP